MCRHQQQPSTRQDGVESARELRVANSKVHISNNSSTSSTQHTSAIVDVTHNDGDDDDDDALRGVATLQVLARHKSQYLRCAPARACKRNDNLIYLKHVY